MGPSPATPNPAVCIAFSSTPTLSGVEREKAAEFVRATGEALVQLTIEEPLVNDIDECQACMGTCQTEKESIPVSPSRTPMDVPVESPEQLSLLDVPVESPEPLSPLSLPCSDEEQES